MPLAQPGLQYLEAVRMTVRHWTIFCGARRMTLIYCPDEQDHVLLSWLLRSIHRVSIYAHCLHKNSLGLEFRSIKPQILLSDLTPTHNITDRTNAEATLGTIRGFKDSFHKRVYPDVCHDTTSGLRFVQI